MATGNTIGQISAATILNTADYLEIEQSGVSKRTSISSVGTLVANTERPYATSAESIAGSSTTAVLTPATLRAGINAETAAPIYACRAWCNFDGTTVSSSITGTYTRVVGTTETICVATAHGMITGNAIYVDFTSGGGSDNTYIITVTDADTFKVNTVSTSSILSSAFTLPRCPRLGSGNISCISRNAAGDYSVNFSTAMPDAYYTMLGIQTGATTANSGQGLYISGVIAAGATQKTDSTIRIQSYANTTGLSDYKEIDIAFFR